MSLATPNIVGEEVLDVAGQSGNFQAEEGYATFVLIPPGAGRADGAPHVQQSMIMRATDPNVLPQPYSQPGDFTAQYPQLLDAVEIIAMCEEVTAWQAIPDMMNPLNAETWRELNSLAFTSGSTYISFADGECPEEYQHDGTNTTINHKNIGAKKSLSRRDISHSTAIASAGAAMGFGGIASIVGGVPAGEGVPGGSNTATFAMEAVANVKEKEVRVGTTLVLNGWDRLLIEGDVSSNSLEFDGIENQVTSANGSHTNSAPSGTFSAATFDRFLSESCAKPTHIFGHPQAIQEMLSGYFQLGFQGSQLVNFANGDRITPGFNFAGFVNTGVGRLAVVADNNFNRADAGGGVFSSALFALRMTHNGVPLVYKSIQIPLMMEDLVPGCTAISFQVWAATALIIKHRCAHGRFTNLFTGNIVTTCTTIG